MQSRIIFSQFLSFELSNALVVFLIAPFLGLACAGFTAFLANQGHVGANGVGHAERKSEIIVPAFPCLVSSVQVV